MTLPIWPDGYFSKGEIDKGHDFWFNDVQLMSVGTRSCTTYRVNFWRQPWLHYEQTSCSSWIGAQREFHAAQCLQYPAYRSALNAGYNLDEIRKIVAVNNALDGLP